MLSHFLNVSFTLPQALELDKGQDYWWLRVVFPYFSIFTAQQGLWNQVEGKVHSQPATMLINVFVLRTRIKRFNRETVGRRGWLAQSMKRG